MKAPFLCRVNPMNVAHPKKAFNWCEALSCRLGRLLPCGPVRLPRDGASSIATKRRPDLWCLRAGLRLSCRATRVRGCFRCLRLAAVRRLAYEAADLGRLSTEQAAGIRRVKGANKLGVRVGNWLLAKEARVLWQSPDNNTLKGKRDQAILSVLLACGLRRGELAELEVNDIQRRDDHWAPFPPPF